METIERHKQLAIIKKAVDAQFHLNIAFNSRKIEYIRARLVYYKLAKELTTYSLAKIGALVYKDHATVLHSLGKFEIDIMKHEKYNELYLILYKSLKPYFNNYTKADFNFNELELSKSLKEQKIENIKLKMDLKKSVNLTDLKEIKLLELYRSLDNKGKEDVMFKIEIAKKVRDNMQHQELRKMKRK